MRLMSIYEGMPNHRAAITSLLDRLSALGKARIPITSVIDLVLKRKHLFPNLSNMFYVLQHSSQRHRNEAEEEHV